MSTSTSASPPWARVMRERKFVVAGVLLSLLFTVALVSHLSGADALVAFSRPPAHDPTPLGNFSGLGGINGQSDGLERILGPLKPSKEEGFTLVVPTYRRLDDLPKFLENYAGGKIPDLRRIILLWNDIESEPPETFLRSLDKYKKIPVIVEQRHINSLNQRFVKSENIHTDCVLSLDDDMLFQPEDVQLGYDTWKQYGQGRRRMLGFVAREATPEKVYMVTRFETYSMVLTKSSFFHVDWMDAYWSEDRIMTGLRSYVEKHNNCEDILMSFLHAHHTRVPPVFLDLPFTDTGLIKGISTKQGHIPARSACVKHFSNVLGNDTLVSSDLVLSRMQDRKKKKHGNSDEH